MYLVYIKLKNENFIEHFFNNDYLRIKVKTKLNILN
jgi:hypothetical protein